MKNGSHRNGTSKSHGPMVLPEPEPLVIEAPKRPQRLVSQDIVVSLAELDELRAKVTQARGSQKLRMILDAPVPGALIQRMPPQEFLMAVKDIGREDCGEIVELATPEQLSVCLDIDCWKKDQFKDELLDQWLCYLQAGELVAAERVLQALDIEILVMYVRKLYRVYYRVDEDAPEESLGDLVELPDLVYIIEIPFAHDDPRSSLAHGLLQLFMSYGYAFYQQLFEWVRWSIDSDLEETGLQFRKGRLEDQGFIDYYEAIGIYQALPLRMAPPQRVEMPPIDDVLPILTSPSSGSLFGDAVLAIPEESLRIRLQQELIFLTNKVLCADLIDPGHLQAVKQTTRTVQRTLDLGLESLVGQDPDAAALKLAAHPLEWLFKVGFTTLARLRKKARRIGKQDERFGLDDDAPLSLLPPSWRFVIEVSKQNKPRYHTSLDPAPGANARPFRSMADVERTRALLDTIAMLPVLFFDEFGFDFDALHKWANTQATPEQRNDLHFSHLFLTALGHYVLHGEFVLKPLSPIEIRDFLNQLFTPADTAPHTLDQDFQAKVEANLLKRPGTSAEENALAQRFLADTWETLIEQAAHLPYPLVEAPDVRFMSLFWVAG